MTDENRQKLNDALDEVVNERPLAQDPWSRAVPEPTTHEDQVAEFEEKEVARTEAREEHNARTAGE